MKKCACLYGLAKYPKVMYITDMKTYTYLFLLIISTILYFSGTNIANAQYYSGYYNYSPYSSYSAYGSYYPSYSGTYYSNYDYSYNSFPSHNYSGYYYNYSNYNNYSGYNHNCCNYSSYNSYQVYGTYSRSVVPSNGPYGYGYNYHPSYSGMKYR